MINEYFQEFFAWDE